MGRASAEYDYLTLDEFEELLADKPHNERWELIGGRLVRMMVGARWDHGRIVQNISRHLGNAFHATGSPRQPFTETLKPVLRPGAMSAISRTRSRIAAGR